MQRCGGVPVLCYIDPKRMNHLEIDSDNMYAVVEPYVSVAHASRTMKYGLFHPLRSKFPSIGAA